MRSLLAIILLLLVTSISQGGRPAPADLPSVAPESEGVDARTLAALSEWVRDNPVQLFSIIISRHGHVVYTLYTSGLSGDEAHYLMSVTKSVLSMLIGIAADRGLVRVEAPLAEALPRALFAGEAERARFSAVTLAEVMAMSALDVIDPPRTQAPLAIESQRRFIAAENRVAFALTQPLLAQPGRTFRYNDVGPSLAAGVLQYATGKRALDFAGEALFGPLGFQNAEWMHQDARGLDLGGFGLRLRPIDLHKLGVLYLDGGVWQGKQLVSRAWIARSFTPRVRTRPNAPAPDYGWFWWTYDFGPGWLGRVANGWKGQRLAIFPAQGVVVSLTGCIEDGREDRVFSTVIERFVKPAVHPQPLPPAPADDARLTTLNAEIRATQKRVAEWIEPRMVPSVAPKASPRPFAP